MPERRLLPSPWSASAAGSTAALSRRHLLGLGSLGTLAVAAGCAVPGTSGGGDGDADQDGGTLRTLFMQQAGYDAEAIEAMTTAFEAANPGWSVENTLVAYEALHDKIVISAPAGTYDVILVDCIWTAELADKQMVLDVTDRFTAAENSDLLAGTLATVTYQDRRWGFPWLPGGKAFFFNGPMLAEAGVAVDSTATWDGCVQAARTLKQAGLVEYPFSWSWSQSEALICDYTQLLGAFGGRFLDEDGRPAWNSGGAVTALEWMVMTLQEGLTDPASTKSLEDDVKKALLQRQAAMGLNWDYVYAASKDPAETPHVGELTMAVSPAGPTGQNPAVDGGMGLSVTVGSKNSDAAWNLAAFLASPEQQLAHADNSLPVWSSAYTDELRAGREQMVDVDRAGYENLVSRPQVSDYNAVSQILQASLQEALLGRRSPQQALDDAANQATDVIGG
ncbi:ABC transporter substrate-binding protein [Kineococcus sp. SYSU DK003]|uniref:ABC transporter substrate-binding protein n=1 Tax=Kineococcus sp. SYSU DK003 TaxID=3383124 RepID=UPI003D7CEA5A